MKFEINYSKLILNFVIYYTDVYKRMHMLIDTKLIKMAINNFFLHNTTEILNE